MAEWLGISFVDRIPKSVGKKWIPSKTLGLLNEEAVREDCGGVPRGGRVWRDYSGSSSSDEPSEEVKIGL